MKILYLHQYFNTPDMPGGTRSYELGRRLVDMGHEVHLITSWREPDGKSGWFETQEEGIQVHWLRNPYSNRMGFRKRIRSFVRFAWAASLLAWKLDGDVVFATSTPLTIAIPGILSSLGRRRPLVFEVRDLWPELPIAIGALSNPIAIGLARGLEWMAYHRAEHVVALSPGMAEGVISRGVSSNDVSVIPNSSDLELFKPDPEARDRFRRRHPWIGDRPLVVYTGTLGRINGVGYFARLSAVMRQCAPNARFLVVGDGAEWSEVEALAEELGVLGVNFRMWRRLPKRDLPEVLAAADIATSLFIDEPAMWNNSANKFFDALSTGTPLAVNYRGWQADILQKHDAGIVMDPTNPEHAAEELLECLQAPRRLAAMSVSARALAEYKFSREDHARKLEQVLVSVVTGAGSFSNNYPGSLTKRPTGDSGNVLDSYSDGTS